MGRGTVYNNLYTPEIWAKLNPDNKGLLDDFVAYKRSADKSPQTIEQYYQMIRLFFCWNYLYNNDKFFVDLKKRELVRFFSYAVETMGWSSNRTATVKSALSSMSNYIENILDDEYEDFRNIVTKIEISEKQPVREKTVLTQEQIDDCLSKLVKAEKYQIACYLALAVASGSRKQELLRFKTDYFKDEYIKFGCLYETPEKIKTKGRTSKGKMLKKYTFVSMFKPYFDLWMKYRKENNIESEWLFVSRSANGEYKQASVAMVNNWCVTISEILGMPFYSHAARHRYVTMMKESKLPDGIIVTLMGWESKNGSGLSMVSVYSDLDESDMLADYFDEDGIKSDIKVGTLADVGSSTNSFGRR